MVKNHLTIGCLVHGNKIPAWYAYTIDQLRNAGKFEVFLVLLPPLPKPSYKPIARGYALLESFWFRHPYQAGKLVDLPTDLPSVHLNANSYHWTDNEIQAVQQFEPDLLYTIHDDLQLENISSLFRFGVWYPYFDSTSKALNLPLYFPEVMEGSSAIKSALIMRIAGTDRILYEGLTTPVPHSILNTFNSVAWKTAGFLLYRLETLLSMPDNFIYEFPLRTTDKPLARISYSNAGIISRLFKNLRAYLRYRKGLRNTGKFQLYISAKDPWQHPAKNDLEPIQPPQGHFYADPFVIEDKSRQYLFFEDHDANRGKAHISMMEIKGKEISTPVIVLDQPYHLSYPFVFKWQDEYYMVPETSGEKRVELYKASRFPVQWEFMTNLMEDISLTDVTLQYHDEKWWMFANAIDHPFTSTNDQLLLFYAKDLIGSEWKPHPMNPVVTDIRHCRSAGRLIRKDGKWFRPAQNNASTQYGYGLSFNEIIVWDEKHYRESTTIQLKPEAFGMKAMHHYDQANGLWVYDGIPG